MKNPPLLAIVVPCYCEEAVVEETARRLTAVVDRLVASGDADARSHILFVNDGSTDRTWALIEQLHRQNRRVDGLNLAANVGHQAALLAGLDVAAGRSDAVVSIDADLQDDPDVIPQMVAAYRAGADVVFGVRRSRTTDSRFKRVTALAFYRLMNALGTPTVYNHADFRLLSRRAARQLCRYRERNLFLRGIVPLIGYPSAKVYYDRAERFAGESKYPLRRMVNFAIDGITSFSVRPVRFVFALGCVFVLIALVAAGFVLWSWMKGTLVQGWASLFLSMWFIGGCVLMALGVIGEYIGKIYIEVKDRPRYNVERTLFHDEEDTRREK
mgnify:FL=1